MFSLYNSIFLKLNRLFPYLLIVPIGDFRSVEISRKNLRSEVLERIKYVKTCVMARELCLLVRTNRAVLEPKDVQEVCQYISTLCKEEGCSEPSEICTKAAKAVGSADEEKYLDICVKAAQNVAKQEDRFRKRTHTWHESINKLVNLEMFIAPFVPSPFSVVEYMLKLADLKAGEILFDMGSGDGRTVIMAAKNFGARGVGIELREDFAKKALGTISEWPCRQSNHNE